MSVVAVVTWTKDGHKKPRNRRWQDGTLRVAPSKQAVLVGEDGQEVGSGKVPGDVPLTGGGDEFELCGSVLVLIDHVISGQGDAAAALVPGPTGAPSQPARCSNENLPAPAVPPVLRRFSGPRRAQPKLPAPEPPEQHQPRSFPAPSKAFPAAQPPLAMPASRERTAEEIMQLLSGLPAAEDANQEPSMQPPAKRARPLHAEAAHLSVECWNKFAGERPQRALAAPVQPPAQQSLQQAHPGTLQPAASHQGRTWGAPSEISRQLLQPAAKPNRPPAVTGSIVPAGPPTTQLHFASAEECARPQRTAAVPDRFSTPAAYQHCWGNVLVEEVNLRLAESAQSFHAACSRAAQQGGGEVALQSAMQRARVPYHGQCELSVWRTFPNRGAGWGGAGRKGKGKDKGRHGNEDEREGGDGGTTKAESVYLILKSGRMKASEYRRGDLWVVSNHPLLQSGWPAGIAGDNTRAPWTAVARSLWHGPNQDGKFEIEFLGQRPPALGRSQAVFALKGPDASTELALLDLLRSGTLASLPILPHLLGAGIPGSASSVPLPATQPPPRGNAASSEQLAEPAPAGEERQTESERQTEADGGAPEPTPADDAAAVISRFVLNEEQAAVVRQVASWCTTGGSGPPMKQGSSALIHGPFGCGKSSLLCALVHFVLAQRARPGSAMAGARVLVSAHTNVAVDRVLLGLLEAGCTDFLRVGPLRRINRSLLPHSLHASESKATATAAAELREMLREGAGSPAEEAVLRAELAAAERGAERQRRRLLQTVPVVGVTCCSSLLPALDGQRFDLVVLDECSQMVEPLSLAPMVRAQCRWLIAAGDPEQLPPVVASPPHVCTAAGAPPRGKVHGLLRPLFVRLAGLGTAPHLLRRQYRCHPAISEVPNRLFYGGRLLDGCSAAQRPSLLPGLPAVVVMDVRGQEQHVARSTSNAQEAAAVARVVAAVLQAGVPATRCGIICFYRAQAAAVKAALGSHAAADAARQAQERVRAAAEATTAPAEGSDAGGVVEGADTEGADAATGVQVATVDAFQGAEKDIIVLTTAITRPGAFASDACRLNVALTRARHNLIVVGCAPALQQSGRAFSELLQRARATPGGFSMSGHLPLPQNPAQPVHHRTDWTQPQ